MGKRYVDNESNFETPNNKRRKTENLHQSNDTLNTPASTTPEVAYSLTTDIVAGVVLTDLCSKKWRCGKPIGKGSFGEIFLASDDILHPVTSSNAKFVVKIEPHKSGPLFVEIHCLIKAGKATDEKPLPLGMPTYMASGGHYFGPTRYRFLILPRYDFDLHSIIKYRQVETKNILIIANQLIDILEHIHDCGYAHSDIKAENIMIGKCTYNEKKINSNSTVAADAAAQNAVCIEKVSRRKAVASTKNGQVTNAKPKAYTKSYRSESSVGDKSNGSSDDYENASSSDEDDESEGKGDVVEESHESEAGSESDSDNDKRKDKDFKPMSRRGAVEFGGSNPVRSCRMENNKTQMYADMVTSHYLRRPTKKVNYCENEVDEEKSPRKDDDDDDDWAQKNHYLKRIYPSAQTSTMEKLNRRDNVNRIEPKQNDIDENGREANDSDAKLHTEDRIHLIDFGLALKFIDSNGVHRPFVMDQRRAHDGTLEFTSRDAHMGAHSRRSDLECLAYNLIYWNEGFLPWKNEKIMSQPEQVHRMKEYFMTDIEQLYKKIYNVPIPTFIYEFLTHVANLAYHDRPNYNLCRDIFTREYLKLGHKKDQMVLNVANLKSAPLRKPDADDAEIMHIGQKMTDVAKMMKMGMIMPFCETPTSQNQISPKNLRSKTTQNPKKRRTKFSWTDILSTDPDQIARQRAEKEFEREQCDQTPVRRYTGNPTYAILQTENRKLKNKFDTKDKDPTLTDTHGTENHIKGYTKPMMDIWRKRQLLLIKQFQLNSSVTEADKPTGNEGGGRSKKRKQQSAATSEKSFSGNSADDVRITATNDETLACASPLQEQPAAKLTKARKRKPGLRRVVVPTKKIANYRDATNRRRKQMQPAPPLQIASNNMNRNFCPSDEYSNCSSNIDSSEASQCSNATVGGGNITNAVPKKRRKYNSSCGMSSPASEEDSRDSLVDYRTITKTRHTRTRGVTSTSKPLMISDEDSRDTTDYSPIKTRHKRSKDGRANRKNKRTAGRKGVYGKKMTSSLIRAFTRG